MSSARSSGPRSSGRNDAIGNSTPAQGARLSRFRHAGPPFRALGRFPGARGGVRRALCLPCGPDQSEKGHLHRLAQAGAARRGRIRDSARTLWPVARPVLDYRPPQPARHRQFPASRCAHAHGQQPAAHAPLFDPVAAVHLSADPAPPSAPTRRLCAAREVPARGGARRGHPPVDSHVLFHQRTADAVPAARHSRPCCS